MSMRAGSVGSRSGAIMAAAGSMKITVIGRGGHGSWPHQTVDPVLLAAHIVIRLQDIVSREANPSDLAVLTVGSLQAGQTENIIPDRRSALTFGLSNWRFGNKSSLQSSESSRPSARRVARPNPQCLLRRDASHLP